MDRTFHGELRTYRGELIQYQSNHDGYACFCKRVAMSDNDETYSSTRVPVVRCAWASADTSSHAMN
jgi:hypothetical protein